MKNIKLVALLLICIESYSSCNSSKKNPNTVIFNEDNVSAVQPTSINILPSFNLLTSPTKIYSIDSLLFIVEAAGSKFVHIYNLKSNSFISSTGVKSNDTIGLVSCWELSFNTKKKVFWVDDLVSKKLVEYSIDSVLSNKNYIPRKVINLNKSSQLCYFPTLIDRDSTIFVSPDFTGFKSRRLFFIDKTGVVYKSSGILPGIQKDFSLAINSQSFQAILTVDYDRKKIVLVDFYSDKIEVYNPDGKKLFYISGPDQFEPEFTTSHIYNTDMMNLKKSTRIGYLDVKTTPNYIYALYSGKEVQDKNFSYGNVIYVFDWNGKALFKIPIKKSADAFAVNEPERIIYTTSLKGQIIKYKY